MIDHEFDIDCEAHADTAVSFADLGRVSRPFRKTVKIPDQFVNTEHAALAAAPRTGVLIQLGIPGWLQTADALKLYELAFFNNDHILEFGTNRGLSASIIGRAILARASDGQLLTIEANSALAAIARKNLLQFNLSNIVEVIEGDALLMTRMLLQRNYKCRFCFVDHSHAFESVYEICELLPILIKPGGFVMFHDYTDRRNTRNKCVGESGVEYGVYNAVEEALDMEIFSFYGVYGCSALYRRRA